MKKVESEITFTWVWIAYFRLSPCLIIQPELACHCLCRSDWSWNHEVPSASASQAPGLKVWTTAWLSTLFIVVCVYTVWLQWCAFLLRLRVGLRRRITLFVSKLLVIQQTTSPRCPFSLHPPQLHSAKPPHVWHRDSWKERSRLVQLVTILTEELL